MHCRNKSYKQTDHWLVRHMFFQTCITLILPWGTKEDHLKNVRAVLFYTLKAYKLQNKQDTFKWVLRVVVTIMQISFKMLESCSLKGTNTKAKLVSVWKTARTQCGFECQAYRLIIFMPLEKKLTTNLPEDNQTSTPFIAVYVYVMSCLQIWLNLTETWFIVLYKTDSSRSECWPVNRSFQLCYNTLYRVSQWCFTVQSNSFFTIETQICNYNI